MKNPNSSLQKYIIVCFCAFTLLFSIAFSAFNFLHVYVVEDAFLERALKSEAQFLQDQFQLNGHWTQPREASFFIAQGLSALPEDLAQQYRAQKYDQEYATASGQYFHLTVLDKDGPVFLVYQAENDLIVRSMVSGIIQRLSILTFISIVIACVLAWLLGKTMLKPLTQLAKLVENADPLRLPEHFSTSYPRNEIGVLAQTLEHLMQRVRQFLQRESQFNRDASHELRTPIAIVSGALELLKTKPLDTAEKKLVLRIEDANREMAQTVHTLLCLAREESTEEQSHCYVLALIEKNIIEHQHLLEDKDIDIDIDHTISPQLQVPLNNTVFNIIISNLISNAFRFTPAGSIRIAFQNKTLSVCDTGSGIDEALQENVVELGVRADDSTGTGTGLSIVQRLCESFHCQLKVKSSPKGTCVSIEFLNLTE